MIFLVQFGVNKHLLKVPWPNSEIKSSRSTINTILPLSLFAPHIWAR